MIKRKIIFLILCFLFMQTRSLGRCADNSIPDWLRLPLDTGEVMGLVRQGWELCSDFPNKSLLLADLGLSKSQKIGWTQGAAESLLLAAKANDYLGVYQKSLQLDFYSLALSKSIKDSILIARSLRQAGSISIVITKFPDAKVYLEKSYLISSSIHYLKGMASALSDLGLVYYNLSDNSKALKYYLKSIALKIKLEDTKNIATTYRSIGLIYLEYGNFEKAFDFYLKSLNLSQTINDKWGISNSYSSLGALSLSILEYEKALNFFKLSLPIKEEINDKFGIGKLLMNIGLAYSKLEMPADALIFQKKSTKIFQEIGDLSNLAIAYSGIGHSFQDFQKYDSADYYFRKCLAFDILIKSKLGIIEDNLNLASNHLKWGKFFESKKYLNQSAQLLKTFSTPALQRDFSELQSLLFEKTKNYKESLIAYKRFILLSDSIVNQNKKTEIALKEAKYEFDKKALADSLRNRDVQKAKDLQIKIQDSELQQQNVKQSGLIVGLLMLCVLAWLLFSRYKAASKQRVVEKKLLLLENERAVIDERTRVANEMHDDVGADLSNLLLKIRMNEHPKNAYNAIDIGGLKNSANNIIQKIDEIIWSLNSEQDTLRELINFIARYYETLLSENHLNGAKKVPSDAPGISISAELRRNVFLTVKEILNNALKHSKADKFNLDINIINGMLGIAVSDNGNGFDAGKAYSGNGLRSIKKRVEQHNGKVSIQSNSEIGTMIQIEFPFTVVN